MVRRTILLLLLGATVLIGCAGVSEKRDYYYRLGGDYYRKCDYKLAETYFQNSVQVDPEFTDGYKRLADCCIWQNRWKEAESLYRQVIQMKPDDQDARLSLVELLIIEGRIRESRLIFAALPLPENDHPRARLLSGMIDIYEHSNDLDKGMASEHFTRLFSDYRQTLAFYVDDKDICRHTFTMAEQEPGDQAQQLAGSHALNTPPMPPKDVESYPAKPSFNDRNGTVLYRYRGNDATILSHPVLMIAGGLMFVLIVFKRSYMDRSD